MTVAGENSTTEVARPFLGGIARARIVPPPVAQPSGKRTSPGAHRLNVVMAACIMVFLLLVPIPLGSNRPAFWMIWSTVVGMMAFAYGAALLWLRTEPRFQLAEFPIEIGALVVLCLFIGLQILPVAGWLPGLAQVNVPEGVNPSTLSLDTGNSRLVLIQFLTFGLLLFLTLQVAANRQRARQMVTGIVVVVALFAVVGLLSLTQWGDTLLGFEKQIYLGYATGTFINRNSFATFLAVGLTLSVAVAVETLAGRKSATIGRFLGKLALVTGCMILIAAALLATGSRMGTLAGVSGSLVAAILGFMSFRGIGRVGVIATLVLAVLAVVAVVGVFGGTLVERLVLSPGIDQTRVDGHRIIWEAILQRPWFGYGAGAFPTAFQFYQRPPLSAEFIWNNSHSTYLALWFEMGLIAGSIPLLIIALLGLRAVRGVRDPSSTSTSIAAIGAIVVFAVHSLLDFSAEIEANAFLFTVILALGAAGGVSRRVRS